MLFGFYINFHTSEVLVIRGDDETCKAYPHFPIKYQVIHVFDLLHPKDKNTKDYFCGKDDFINTLVYHMSC